MEYTPETYNVVHQLYRKKKKKKLKDGENLKKKKQNHKKPPVLMCDYKGSKGSTLFKFSECLTTGWIEIR